MTHYWLWKKEHLFMNISTCGASTNLNMRVII